MVREMVPPGQGGKPMDDCHSAEVKEDGWDNSRFLARVHKNQRLDVLLTWVLMISRIEWWRC